MQVHYDRDADLSRLRSHKIAILGFGSQGHAHALNLRDSGMDVCVGLRKDSPSWEKAAKQGLAVFETAEAARRADIVMMLRLQRERMNGSFVPSSQEYFHYFGLDQKKLAYAKPDALVMHPGPMNRGVEIDSIVADGAQSLIREQVEMGVAVRMAVLEALARNLPNA